jgi:type II secretory pathway pseudopilin PulG
MNRLRTSTGITLIEILSAIGLFSVLATALTTMVIGSVKSNDDNRTTAAATALAQNKIEQLRAIHPSDTVTMGSTQFTTGSHSDPNNPITEFGASGGTFTRTWTVSYVSQYYNGSVVGNRPGMAQVKVKVSWTTPQTRSVELVSYVCTKSRCG